MDFKALYLFLLCIFVLKTSAISYKNAKVVEFKVENENQLEKVRNLELNNGFKFWDPPQQIGAKVELIIQAPYFLEFQELAEEIGIEYQVLTDNVQSWFETENSPKRHQKDISTNFAEYKTYEQILQYLDDIHSEFPNVTEIFTIGNSFEGRPIKGIKITKNEENPIFFIDANIHAREWISSATAVWLIHELLTTVDVNVRDVIDGMTWIIIPVLNPDGYVYTHVEDRLWRKTRSTHASLLCVGADPNRNFAYNFGKTGSSQVACTDTFSGREPFSEPEAKALVDYYEKIVDKVKIYLAFHSAAEMILYPMGHTASFDEVPNVDDLDAIAAATVAAVKQRYGTTYAYGSSYLTLSATAGTTKDHMYGHYKTMISFTYEFRAAKNGNRFILPVDEIVPNSEEAFDGIIAMIGKSKELGYF